MQRLVVIKKILTAQEQEDSEMMVDIGHNRIEERHTMVFTHKDTFPFREGGHRLAVDQHLQLPGSHIYQSVFAHVERAFAACLLIAGSENIACLRG